MDRAWLERELAAGRSIESIAREVGKAPSTVAYWARKFGLASRQAERHAARGGIEAEQLQDLIERDLTTREIAEELGVGQTTVRHWLRRHGLSTRRARGPAPADAVVVRECRTHGITEFVKYSDADHHRCRRCRYDRVIARRRRIKEILVEEAGGACELCGYDRYLGALQFHHRDPKDKEFGIAVNGSARSLERARAEARKCVLLCANCHAEVEWGAANLPSRETSDAG